MAQSRDQGGQKIPTTNYENVHPNLTLVILLEQAEVEIMQEKSIPKTSGLFSFLLFSSLMFTFTVGTCTGLLNWSLELTAWV